MRLSWILPCFLLVGAQEPTGVGYDDTPRLPGQKWRVHDKARPAPPVVAPGAHGAPPSDAIVLFSGADLSAWQHEDGSAAKWKLTEGAMAAGGGDLVTKQGFGSCQLHLEWRSPNPPKNDSQGRGNSGVYLMGRYEVQVLDSWQNVTYADGQAAALYGQQPPLVNACRAPGEWQSYDIFFRAPVFGDNGALASPALVTVMHNGVLVHHAQALLGATAHRAVASYSAHPDRLPLKLQDHGDPVEYRNLWIRPLE
ncbi:MAG: DUF1080 domain-containing protein [Planctomycetota bacterium]|nr:DUF1080 domain-containing protein [Planctomycetota bacterium]